MRKIRTAVLISGRGSNMRALVDAAAAPESPVDIVAVISNRPNAGGLSYAKSHGIATEVIDHKAFDSRQHFDAALNAVLVSRQVELVACAGFMRIMTPSLIDAWDGRMINIHPSLLPAYRGLHTHERALADGTKTHGCTVHYVSAELDAGEIIMQAEVAVEAGDSPEKLAERVLEQEHRIYPLALFKVARRLQAKTST
jgi:phosphoribosylglycinamide formyltransferase-1